ncbi:MAG: hypothetical protein Fur009_8320 [Candidatus Microgenomates bacterium]
MNNHLLELERKTPFFSTDRLNQKEIFSFYNRQLEDFSSWWELNSSRFDDFSFRIGNQRKLFLETLRKKGFEEAFSTLRLDVYGYYLEYIKQESYLPFSLRFKNGRLVGDFYTDKPITDMVDKEERDGAVYDATADLEKELQKLTEREFIFRVSPDGWTGRNYQYTETQSQLYWKDGEKIRGLTIRSKTPLSDIENFLKILGIDIFSKTDEKERIKSITRLNLKFQDLPNFLKLFSLYFENTNREEKLDMDKIKQMINTPDFFIFYDEISDLIEWTRSYLLNVINSASNHEEVDKSIDFLFGFILMKLTEKEQEKIKTKFDLEALQQSIISYDTLYPQIYYLNYDRLFTSLKAVSGCSGGGVNNEENEGLFGTSSWRGLFENSIFGVRGIKNEDEFFECPKCHGKIPSGKGIEVCPHCGMKKQDVAPENQCG